MSVPSYSWKETTANLTSKEPVDVLTVSSHAYAHVRSIVVVLAHIHPLSSLMTANRGTTKLMRSLTGDGFPKR